MVGNGSIYLYWRRCGRLKFSTGDGVVSTGDGVVGYVAVDLYWGHCGRIWGDTVVLWLKTQISRFNG